MTYHVKFFSDISLRDIETRINAFFAANPTFVLISVSIATQSSGFAAMVAYSS